MGYGEALLGCASPRPRPAYPCACVPLRSCALGACAAATLRPHAPPRPCAPLRALSVTASVPPPWPLQFGELREMMIASRPEVAGE